MEAVTTERHKPSDPELLEMWRNWGRRQRDRVEEAFAQVPPAPIEISLTDGREVPDRALEDALLDDPRQTLDIGHQVLAEGRDADPGDIELRPHRLPDPHRKAPHEIRGKDIGQLITVTGTVLRAGGREPYPIEAVCECLRCGAVIAASEGRWEPLECSEDQNGCDRSSTAWKLLERQSTWTMRQQVTLHDPSEAVRGPASQLPVRLQGRLAHEADLVAGDRVEVTGILDPVRPGNQGTGFRLTALHVERHDRTPTVTEKDRTRLLNAVNQHSVPEVLVESFAPNIVRLSQEKLAVLLALATAGDERPLHVLLVGDPGTAKSRLLDAAAHVAPNAKKVTGPTASGPGLTGVTEQTSSGLWRTRPGALPRADGGALILEELSRVDEADRDHLHEAMGDHVVTITKAGNQMQWPARCAILAAMNPTGDRFDPGQPITTQTGLPPTLIDRFDVILPVTDDPDPDRDRAIAEAIRADEAGHEPDIPFAQEDLQKLLLIARGITPSWTSDAEDLCDEWYLDCRGEAASGDMVKPTWRDYRAAVRLAQAHARLCLRDRVTVEDVDTATDLIDVHRLTVLRREPRVRFAEEIARHVRSNGGPWEADAATIGDTLRSDMTPADADAVPDSPTVVGSLIKQLDREDLWEQVGLDYDYRRQSDQRTHRFTKLDDNATPEERPDDAR